MVDESESDGEPDRMLSIQSLRYGTCPDAACVDRCGNDCCRIDRRNLVFHGSGGDVYGLDLTGMEWWSNGGMEEWRIAALVPRDDDRSVGIERRRRLDPWNLAAQEAVELIQRA